MIVRPHYCNDSNCPIYKEAKRKETETSTSTAQKMLDNHFSNNPECRACKEKYKNNFTV